MSTSRREFLQIVVVLGGASAIGCNSTPAPVDAPSGGTDAPTGGTDAPTGGTDAPTPADDAPTGGTDAPASDPDAPGGGGCADTMATILLNHGHVLDVPVADVTAGVDHTYDIMGTSLHTHSVTVTAADFATIASGGTATVVTTLSSAHMHTIMVRCVPA